MGACGRPFVWCTGIDAGMRFAPIVAAPLQFDANGLPFSAQYGDLYHPAAGAALQANHVFLGGNGLPQRWRGSARFVILEAGFGLGNNFLATWQAWREDAQRCEQLVFISVEKHPFSRADLSAAHRGSPWPELAVALVDAWPPLTPDLHTLSFDGCRVRLLLAFGDIQAWLPQLVASVDAFYLDGFAPAKNPAMWELRVCKAFARLAAPGATLATWSAAHALRDGLRSAGFAVVKAPGSGGKRDITLARFEPTFVPRHAPVSRSEQATRRAATPRHAVIIGGGLAGCAVAWALAQQGWHSVVLERHAAPAQGASGNPAGAFHGIVNRQDGAHARFNRAAAFAAHSLVAPAIRAGNVLGDASGLIRLEPEATDPAAMRAMLAQLGLPGDYVRALDATQAAALSGLPLTRPAWFYPTGGWVDPAALAREMLAQAGKHSEWRGGVDVAALKRSDQGWQLVDATGRKIAAAATLVLANAGEALGLLGGTLPDAPPTERSWLDPRLWPMQRLRGQISRLRCDRLPTGSALPRLAVTGSGFLLPPAQGELTFGATSHAVDNSDTEASVRLVDHQANLDRLALMGEFGWSPRLEDLSGRVGWRWSCDDRLPIVGAVPSASAHPPRLDQSRFVPREDGLYVFIGLGSRGITWAPLGAQALASMISGAPAPLPAGLLDAIDPARFAVRRFRNAARAGGSSTATAAAVPLD